MSLSCCCLETHQVSLWGFVLLMDVEATLVSRKQSIEEVVVVTEIGGALDGPLLTALASKVVQQQEMVKNLDIWAVGCNNKEGAEDFATLVEHCQEEALQGWFDFGVFNIGPEGWTAVRRGVERLAAARPRKITVSCGREALKGGRKEDMKATWFAIQEWAVVQAPVSDSEFLWFDKEIVGDVGGWVGFGQRKGLGAVIDMSEEEFMEEVRYVEELNNYESSTEEEEDEEEGEQEEEEAEEDEEQE